MKVALVHDWLTGMRGGEKVLEAFCRLFPDAELFTLLHIPGSVSPLIEDRKIHTSFLRGFPFVKTHYRYFLPLMPCAIERLNVRSFDLILSSSHCVAKAVKPGEHSVHICYCHTPMRYLWDQFDPYFNAEGSREWASRVMRIIAPYLKKWDARTCSRVRHFIANSRHVQKRIENHYRRESSVIHPPVDTELFTPMKERGGEFFLVVSAFAPYKRVDLAVEAFNELGYPLVVVGQGQDATRLQGLGKSNVQFAGWLPNEDLRAYYARCRALVFCGEEDFGITPLEAQAMGKPVIAFGRGGVLETVIPDSETWRPDTEIPREKTGQPTGVFFYESSAASLVSAVKHFEAIEHQFNPDAIRNHSLKFGAGIFSERIQRFIEDRLIKTDAEEV